MTGMMWDELGGSGAYSLYGYNPHNERILSSTPIAQLNGTGQTVDLWDRTWHQYLGDIPLSSSSGRAGTRGRAMILSTALNSSGIDVLYWRKDAENCRAISKNYDRFREQCSADRPLICSSDYVPPNSQSISGGRWRTNSVRLAGCPRTRRLNLGAPGNWLYLRPPRGPRTTTMSLSSWAGRNADSITIEMATDAASYVEVHDKDLYSTSHQSRYGTRGVYGANFRRYREGYANPSNRRMIEVSGTEQPRKTVTLNNTNRSSWKQIRTIKYYDGGACSVVLPYRTLVNELAIRVRNALQVGGSRLRVDTYTTNTLTPVLRAPKIGSRANPTQSQGVLSFTVGVVGQLDLFGITNQTRVLLNAVFSLDVQNGKPSAVIHKLSLTKVDGTFLVNLLGRFVDIDAGLQKVSDVLKTQLTSQLNKVLGDFKDVIKRTNYRPEGIELVLAEDLDDPAFSLMNLAGLCNPPTTGSGVWGAVQHPQPGSQTAFRDSKDLDQRLRLPSSTLDLLSCIPTDNSAPCGLIKR